MNISLGERLIIPAAVTLLVALLSGGAMFSVGGATQRMKTVLRCMLLFTAGTLYCMAWHDVLATIFGWEDAWIVIVVGIAIGSTLLCRRLLAKRSNSSGSNA
jgi:hypothetical protein